MEAACPRCGGPELDGACPRCERRRPAPAVGDATRARIHALEDGWSRPEPRTPQPEEIDTTLPRPTVVESAPAPRPRLPPNRSRRAEGADATVFDPVSLAPQRLASVVPLAERRGRG